MLKTLPQKCSLDQGCGFNSHFDKNNGLKIASSESNYPGFMKWFAGMLFECVLSVSSKAP